jgi:4-amino-4-deoxy-L-arabinose transferase-like glycosyltransferase
VREDWEGPLVLWAIFLFALLVRVLVISGTIGFQAPAAAEPAADSRIHIALVQNLLGGRGFALNGPTAMTPPLYIFFLAGIYRLFDSPATVRLVQAALGAAGCVLAYLIGRRIAGPATGLVAAMVLSLHPLTAYLAGLHLTENLFLFLVLLMILLSLHVAERPTPAATAGLGVVVGLAVLTRAVFLAFLPFLLAWTLSVWGARNTLTYRVFGLIVVTALAVILPWTIRNYVVLGTLVPVQSNGGMVFWAGNNPLSEGGVVLPTPRTWTEGPPPDDDKYGWRSLTVGETNQRYVHAALTWIWNHPRDYARLLMHKLTHLYGLSRAVDERESSVPAKAEPILVAYHVAFLALALGGLGVTYRQWRTLSLLLALIVFTNLTALLFGGSARYTIPMLPSLSLLAAVAVVAGWNRTTHAPAAAR